MSELLRELIDGSREYGVNNNSIKEAAHRVEATGTALCQAIYDLPPQGRTIALKAEDIIRTSEHLR